MKSNEALSEHLRALDPGAKQAQRMQRSVEHSVEATQTSLLDEWLELVRERPLANIAYACAAASLLLLLSPLGSVLFSLMRRAF